MWKNYVLWETNENLYISGVVSSLFISYVKHIQNVYSFSIKRTKKFNMLVKKIIERNPTIQIIPYPM